MAQVEDYIIEEIHAGWSFTPRPGALRLLTSMNKGEAPCLRMAQRLFHPLWKHVYHQWLSGDANRPKSALESQG